MKRIILIPAILIGVGLLLFWFSQQLLPKALAQPAETRQSQPAAIANDPIITDTIWTVAGSPYVITAPVTIMPGAILTIEAGVTVLGAVIDYPLLTVAEEAHLLVEGTAESPVTFSSQADSGPGDWSGVAVFGSAHVEHALFQNSLFNFAIAGESGGPIIIASTVFSQSVYGPSVAINALHRLQMTDVAFVNVVNNRILVDIIDSADSLSDNATVTAHPGLEGYEWGPDAGLYIPAGITLTIEAGVSLLARENSGIVNFGHLQAIGTPQLPVTITAASGVPGDWAGIHVIESDSSIYLENVTIEKAHFALAIGGAANVSIIQSRLSQSTLYPLFVGVRDLPNLHMENVHFDDNAVSRIMLLTSDTPLDDHATLTAQPGLEGYEWGSDPVLEIPAGITLTLEPGVSLMGPENGIVWLNGGHLKSVGTPQAPVTFTAASGISGDWDGISIIDDGSAYLEQSVVEKGLFNLGIGPTNGPVNLKQSRFSQSAYAPLIVDVAALHRLQMDEVHFQDNAVNRIMLDTDTASPLSDNAYLTAQSGLEGYELWHGGLEPFDLIVPTGFTLTAEAGVTLFVPEGDKVQVQGHLQASGTLTHPVTFTGVLTGMAGWGGLHLQGTAVLSHTHVTQSQASGILVDGGNLTATCSTFSHNQTAGIGVTNQGFPQIAITASNFYDNEQAGLNNENSSQVEARHNWWGDASGPGGIGPGSGDAVWGEVLYEPWLTETAVCPLPDEAIEPELLMALTAVPLVAAPGETITYTLVLTNSGNVSLHELSSTVEVGSGFSLPESLAPGTSFTASYTYTVLVDDLPGPLVNTVSVTAVPPDHEPIVVETAVTVILQQPGFILYLPLVQHNWPVNGKR
jgi:hypothetical protein